MASKGPKSDAAPKAPKPAAKVAGPSAVAEAGVAPAKPAAPKTRTAAAAVKTPPVPAVLPAPVPEVPEPVVVAPAVDEVAPAPIAAAPQVPAPAVSAPEPVRIPDPVLTVEAPKPVAAAAPTVTQKEIFTMENTIKVATDKVQEQAKALFADVNDRTKTAVEKGTKLVEEFNEFSKGNVEAIVESSKIAAKGIETFGQDAAEYSRKHFEGATAALKSLSSVKTPSDFFKLQSDYVRSAFDSIVAETSKNTESLVKLAGEVAQPISNRVALAAEKIKISA
jgi:phasin family protein